MIGNIEATDVDLFSQVMDCANRADPYPLYARPRGSRRDGLYPISTYDEIRSLLFHPKVSSNVVQRLRFPRTGNPFADWIMNPIKERIAHRYRSLLLRDPPEHDGLRRYIMLQFTPERMQRMKGRAAATIDKLIARMQGRRQIDLVEAFAYPLPVAIICELLGVPAQDERKFHAWSNSLIAGPLCRVRSSEHRDVA
jgi:cytochrome P450